MRPEFNRRGGVTFENFLLDHLAREATDAREMAPLARHRHPAATHRLQVAADDARVQRRGLDFMVAAVLLELAEIARVGLHRVVAQSAFDSQAVEMALDDPVPVVTRPTLTRPILTRLILTRVPPGTPMTELGFHAAPL